MSAPSKIPTRSPATPPYKRGTACESAEHNRHIPARPRLAPDSQPDRQHEPSARLTGRHRYAQPRAHAVAPCASLKAKTA